MFGDFMFGSEVREQNIYSSFFIFHAWRYAWRRVLRLAETTRQNGTLGKAAKRIIHWREPCMYVVLW